MIERRIGILIANSRFPEELKLEDLHYPENDVDGLAKVLSDKDRGNFDDLITIKNKPRSEILPVLNKTLTTVNKNDLVLIYYSGHGKLNRAGRLHLATRNSKFDALEATAISIGTIREFLDVSETKKVVLVLDCCFSGAIGNEFLRGDVDNQLQMASEGRGTYIMTASTGIQVAKEKEADRHGIFTKHLIIGLESGNADLDGNGLITMDELYSYVHEKVIQESHQKPMKWNLNVQGDLVVAANKNVIFERRNSQIRKTLFSLAREGILPEEIFDEARKILSCPEKKLSGRQLLHSQLLEKMVLKKISVGEFISEWYPTAQLYNHKEYDISEKKGPQILRTVVYLFNSKKRIIIPFMLVFTSLFTLMSLISYDSQDPSIFLVHHNVEIVRISNFLGIIGAHYSGVLIGFFGVGSFSIPIVFLLLCIRNIKSPTVLNLIKLLFGSLILAITIGGLLSISQEQYLLFGRRFSAGGVIGSPLKNFLIQYCGISGSLIIYLSSILVGCRLSANLPITKPVIRGYNFLSYLLKDAFRKITKRRY